MKSVEITMKSRNLLWNQEILSEITTKPRILHRKLKFTSQEEVWKSNEDYFWPRFCKIPVEIISDYILLSFVSREVFSDTFLQYKTINSVSFEVSL